MDRIVHIKLDQERPMLLSLKAIKKFQELTGINMLGRVNVSELTPEQLSSLLWVLLNTKKVDGRWQNEYEPPVITTEQIDNIFSFKDLGAFLVAFNELLTMDMPDPKDIDPNPQSLPAG